MSRLKDAIKLAKGRCWDGYKSVDGKKAYSKGSCAPKNKKTSGPMEKSIEFAQSAIRTLKKSEVDMPEDGEVFDLSKAGYDAMFHHSMCAKASQDAAWGPSKDDKDDGKKRTTCTGHSKKHESMMLKHALKEASKKGGDYLGGQTNKMRKYMDFMDSEQNDMSKDPDYEKTKKHYSSGGDFKSHKDDKFGEDD